jgi:hypothetical protein
VQLLAAGLPDALELLRFATEVVQVVLARSQQRVEAKDVVAGPSSEALPGPHFYATVKRGEVHQMCICDDDEPVTPERRGQEKKSSARFMLQSV